MNDLIRRGKEYCAECDHVEMCQWYPNEGCEFRSLPSAQTETFEWCHDCKEYDQEKHCCHRWTKQIRKTVAELEADYPQAMKDELEYWKKRAEEAERKGKWIPNQENGTFKIYTCSKCGWNSEAEFNFCPNCGADMRGEENV